MKQNRSILLSCITGVGVLFASCNTNDDIVDNIRIPVQIESGSVIQTKTTTAGNQWTQNDAIGVYMLKQGQPLNSSNIAEGADNVEYKTQAGNTSQSTFRPASNTIYYPQDGGNVDFIAYYPYRSSLTNYIYPVDVSNQATPADIDVLYSNDATNKNKNSGMVDLSFYHALSRLSFTLTSGNGSPNLTGAKIEITNLATTADIDLADGTVMATNSGQTLIANTATDGSNRSAIVIPQALSGTKLKVTLADNVSVFEWTFTDTQFEQGKTHLYSITVSKTGITVSSSGITIWTGTSDPATGGTAQVGYKVGDYYPDPTAIYQNGILISGTAAIGVVFWLDNQVNGDNPYDKVDQHGKIVGLYERAAAHLDESWVTNYGTTYNAGTGWYMPAYGANDYDALYCAYNGMVYETWNTGKPNDISKNYNNRAWFRAKITNAGGDNITDSWYWVSSVNGINNAYCLHFNSGNVEISGNTLSSYKTRAIKSF